jgi:hypothetical protein
LQIALSIVDYRGLGCWSIPDAAFNRQSSIVNGQAAICNRQSAIINLLRGRQEITI